MSAMGDLVRMSVAMVCSTISPVTCGITCFVTCRHLSAISALRDVRPFASCLPMFVSICPVLPVFW